jgi:hypothetical protein
LHCDAKAYITACTENFNQLKGMLPCIRADTDLTNKRVNDGLMLYGRKRNPKFREEEQEGPHNLQAVRQKELSHPPQGVLSLRLRPVRKGQEVRLAVEDRGRQEKEVNPFGLNS